METEKNNNLVFQGKKVQVFYFQFQFLLIIIFRKNYFEVF